MVFFSLATAIIVDSKVQDAVARAVALDLKRPLRETDILWSSWEESSGESGTDKEGALFLVSCFFH